MPTTHHLRSAVFSLLLIGSVCCNKDSSPSPNGTLEIVSDLSMANVQNGVQAVHTTADKRCKTYYYGSFNDKGVPSLLKEVNIHKIDGDSSLNMFLDSAQRVKYMFISGKGVKLNEMIVFDYNTPGKTIIRVMNFDFNGNTAKVIYQTIIDNATQKVDSEAKYASMASGFIHLLNALTNSTVDIFDEIADQLRKFWTGVGLTIFGIIAAGALCVSLSGGLATGICLGAVILILARGSNAKADPAAPPSNPLPDNYTAIPAPPADAAPSPSKQTENTQFASTRFVQGTKNSFTFNFGGGAYCNYIGTFSNSILMIKMNSTRSSILSSSFVTFHKEMKTDPSCAPTLPVFPENQHTYEYASGNISGNSIFIYFRHVTGTPKCNVTFSGTRYGNSYSGVVTMDRNDGVVSTTDYYLNIPIVLD